jgi:hypothetical protein
METNAFLVPYPQGIKGMRIRLGGGEVLPFATKIPYLFGVLTGKDLLV